MQHVVQCLGWQVAHTHTQLALHVMLLLHLAVCGPSRISHKTQGPWKEPLDWLRGEAKEKGGGGKQIPLET